jgi:hypothetical protein
LLYGGFGAVGGFLAAAAAFALLLRSASEEAPTSAVAVAPSALAPPALARSRTTSELFAQQFPLRGGTTDRVDRIAYARQQDLRENLFASWGVR